MEMANTYIMIGVVTTMAVFLISWWYGKQIKEVLGEGVISKMMNLTILALLLFSIMIILDGVQYTFPESNAVAIRGFFILGVPIPLIYSLVTVKRYSDKLKDLADDDE